MSLSEGQERESDDVEELSLEEVDEDFNDLDRPVMFSINFIHVRLV